MKMVILSLYHIKQKFVQSSPPVETAQVRPYFYKDEKIVFENSDFEYIVWMVIDNGNKFNVQVFKNK